MIFLKNEGFLGVSRVSVSVAVPVPAVPVVPAVPTVPFVLVVPTVPSVCSTPVVVGRDEGSDTGSTECLDLGSGLAPMVFETTGSESGPD